MPDCIRIQDGKAAEIFPGVAKSTLVFAEPIMAAIVEVPAGTVAEGDEWNDSTFVAPVPTAEQLCGQVDAIRDARLAAGFADTTTSKTYQCDPDSTGKWTAIGASAGLALVQALNPAPQFPIITADNSIVQLAAADAYALLAGRVMPWVSATCIFARQRKDAILAGNAPADLAAGWP